MPDPDRRTISATESPALFNASPYITRWMLYRKFKHGDVIEPEQTDRMYWGKELQPLLLKKAARDLKLEVQANEADAYQRHANYRLGCTRDALIYDPARGWGSLETKCCFDYGVWMREWNGGQTVPRHYEIQLQHQMLVGDGHSAHTWGVIAAWVCGEMKYFERAPIAEFDMELGLQTAKFFMDMAESREPEPFGSPVEYPLLARLFDPEPDKVLELPENYKLAELARLYKDFNEKGHFYEKGALTARLQLLIGAGRFGAMRLAGGVEVQFRKSKNGRIRIKVIVPDELPDELMVDSDE